MADDEREPGEMPDDKPDNRPADRKPSPKPEPRDAADDLEGLSPEELKERVKRAEAQRKAANKEAQDRRRRLEELEDEKRQRDEATLSETERQKKEREREREELRQAKAEAAEAKTRLVELEIDREVERIAATLTPKPFRYPATVPKLIERNRVEKDNETGKVLGAKEAVERLAKEFPDLLVASPSGGTPPRDGSRRPAGDDTPRRTKNIDPYEQELLEMGGGGRM